MEGKKLFSLELRTDFYPYETSWVVYNLCTGQAVFERDNYEQEETVFMDAICLPENAEYEFIIYDSYGDGLCCSGGYYIVRYDGSTVKRSDFDDGYEEYVEFGDRCPTDEPTPAPTEECENGFTEFFSKVNGFFGFGW